MGRCQVGLGTARHPSEIEPLVRTAQAAVSRPYGTFRSSGSSGNAGCFPSSVPGCARSTFPEGEGDLRRGLLGFGSAKSLLTILGIDSAGALYEDQPHYGPLSALKEQINMGSSLILAGSALLLASLLGIFSAVSGQFYRKEEQYRMLRTIGATRRQIRAKMNGRCLVDPSVSPGLTAPFTQGSLCTVRSRNCSSEPICFL